MAINITGEFTPTGSFKLLDFHNTKGTSTVEYTTPTTGDHFVGYKADGTPMKVPHANMPGGGHTIKDANGASLTARTSLKVEDFDAADNGTDSVIRLVTDRMLWSVFLPQKAASQGICIVGDSISVGIGATAPRTDAWGVLIRERLFGANGENVTQKELQCNFEEAITTGPTLSAGVTFGTEGPISRSLVIPSGESVYFTDTCDFVDVFYEKSVGAGTLSFSVDSDPAYRTVDCDATAESNACSYDGVTGTGVTGSHVFHITATGGDCEITGLIRIGTPPDEGRLFFQRQAYSGHSTKDFVTASALASVVKQGGFSNFLGGLTVTSGTVQSNTGSYYIISLGMNNVYYTAGNTGHKTTPKQYEKDLVRICNSIITANPYNQICLILPYIPDPTPMTLLSDSPHGAYIDAARRAGSSFEACIVDLSAIDFITNSLLDTDGLHPNNAGHKLISDMVSRAIYDYSGRRQQKGNYQVQQTDLTSGTLTFSQPTILIDRSGSGSATHLPIAALVAKMDDYDATGLLGYVPFSFQVYGTGTIDHIQGPMFVYQNWVSGATATLIEGIGTTIHNASGGVITELHQHYSVAKTGSGTCAKNIGYFSPELKTATTIEAYHSYSEGANTPSWHRGIYGFGGTSYGTALVTINNGVVEAVSYTKSGVNLKNRETITISDTRDITAAELATDPIIVFAGAYTGTIPAPVHGMQCTVSWDGNSGCAIAAPTNTLRLMNNTQVSSLSIYTTYPEGVRLVASGYPCEWKVQKAGPHSLADHSDAISNYLTTATAATTYLTIATAASTYGALAGATWGGVQDFKLSYLKSIAQYGGKYNLLTAGNNAATTVVTITSGAAQGTGGKIRYTILAKETTTNEIHVIRGEVPFALCRKVTGFTNTLETDKSTPIHANSASGGTLTAAWAWDVTSNTAPFIKVTPSSSFGSLAELSMMFAIDLESSNDAAITLGTLV